MSMDVASCKRSGTHSGAGHIATETLDAYSSASHEFTRNALTNTGLLTMGTPGVIFMTHSKGAPGW